ncbi:MAG: nucleotidyltransferase family protein [Spongiibacter sp.]|nr:MULTISPECIES: nucleotidyltransferase family protein [Spongiibacter]MBO6754328.1 nucleotidyltransferase family protein [Spongiibacter sp.]|tara:strand:- start:10314 stop:10970 length:657 start_codon:yes stop_codon:yes gene_type:complete
MILAAGFGERMRPLTETTPKPLLRAAGKPLIDYHLEKLAAAGFDDVVVNSAWLSAQIVDYLGDGARYGLRIQHSVEHEPLETAGGIVRALPMLGDEPFLLINGDVWTDIDFAALHSARPDAAELVMVTNPAHHPEGDFALADDGLLREQGDPRYTFAGVSVWQPACFAGLAPGRRPLKPLMQALMARSQLRGRLHRGQWWDIGTPERLAALDAELRSA